MYWKDKLKLKIINYGNKTKNIVDYMKIFIQKEDYLRKKTIDFEFISIKKENIKNLIKNKENKNINILLLSLDDFQNFNILKNILKIYQENFYIFLPLIIKPFSWENEKEFLLYKKLKFFLKERNIFYFEINNILNLYIKDEAISFKSLFNKINQKITFFIFKILNLIQKNYSQVFNKNNDKKILFLLKKEEKETEEKFLIKIKKFNFAFFQKEKKNINQNFLIIIDSNQDLKIKVFEKIKHIFDLKKENDHKIKLFFNKENKETIILIFSSILNQKKNNENKNNLDYLSKFNNLNYSLINPKNKEIFDQEENEFEPKDSLYNY
jgi:hypothetical protein